MLFVSVIDTGPGIAKNEQKKLFNDLQRVTGPLQQDVEGTGLGLSISARIVSAMLGKIGLESYIGHGSTFWFMIPLVECEAPEVSAANSGMIAPLKPLTIDGAVPHVLVAEDIETNQIVMRSVLDKFGCTYSIVKDGIEAFKAIENEDFDVVLMDVSMPRMDGIETTKNIRAMSNGRENVPIIGVTAFAGQEEQISLLAAGMSNIVIKPIKPVQLREAMAAVFNQPKAGSRRSRPNPVPIPDFETAQLLGVDILKAQLDSVPDNMRRSLSDAVTRDLSTWHTAFVCACVNNDHEAAGRAHHALKGVCEGFGISRYAAQLEMARHALLSGSTVETAALDEVLSATLVEIERHTHMV